MHLKELPEEELIKKVSLIAKRNSPYPFKSIDVDKVDDFDGILIIINVNMHLPKKINDTLIVERSMKITNLINMDNILVTYL